MVTHTVFPCLPAGRRCISDRSRLDGLSVDRKIKNPAPAPNHVRFRTNAGFKEAVQGTIPGL